MSQEFTTLISRLKTMKSRYFFVLSTFYVSEAMIELREVEKNRETMNKFNNFFDFTQKALQVYFLLELAKLFDYSDQALHITKIINYTESNLRSLSAKDFAESNQSREFIDELVENYRGMSHTDLYKIKSQLKQHRTTIRKLTTYRNKYLAHDDLKKVDVELTYDEITSILKILEEILNLFSSRFDASTTLYNHIEIGCKNDTKMVVEYLSRFEPYRLKEIDEQYDRELEKQWRPK